MRTRFRIVGAESGELLLRVVNLFVQQGLTVETLSAVAADGGYNVEVEVLDGSPARVELVTEKLRALVLVRAVEAVADLPERVAA
ncbi:hypothetical protein RZN05_03510 [Sphingomonas sp. HF-S4]|uniref:ACT domain-containing protein n=1 Tax=Sphingomonas agrestis TaxID=3080540 RepID=A0ABU3Y3R9_9SPHN|nr:hypothetical protein [Sphingomonas sp. HF-S4]MDV3456036.1 hypothetical protein [Sphingomonas sp. HF-S4]